MHMDRKILAAIAVAAIVVIGAVAAAFLLSKGEKGGVVRYVVIAPKDMKAALSTGQIDGYIAWEPYVSDSVVGGIGDVLMWSGEIMPNHPCCVVAVRNDFLSGTNGTELTARFLRAHMDATEWMLDALSKPTSDNYTLLVNMATQFTTRDEGVVEAAFTHIKYGYEMNAGFKSALEEFTNMYIETNMTTNEKLTERGYTSVGDFIDRYADTSLLEQAKTVSPTDTLMSPKIRLGYLLGDLHQMAQVVAQNKSLLGGTKSIFEKYGLDVEQAVGAPFANGGAEMVAFAAGNVDIGYLGAPPAILQHLNANVGTRIIAQANSEGSGMVVGANAGIDSFKDLVNKTLATPGESSIQFLLLKIALEREGLELRIKT